MKEAAFMKRKPEWLIIKAAKGEDTAYVESVLRSLSLNTVCEAALCPNRGECFSSKTATFMILGKACTRNCAFCNVENLPVKPVDIDEPLRVAQAVLELNLGYVVITSVTRDDLSDGGAFHFARVVSEIKRINNRVVVETLIPDFLGDKKALASVVSSRPEVISHNIETVPRLYPAVRTQFSYDRSLKLLESVKTMDSGILTKSGLMLGLGERENEVLDVFNDLIIAGCDFLTIGQYLAPSKKHYPVLEYIQPEIFERYRETALKTGFKHVESAPFVRSSYMAQRAIKHFAVDAV